jgi:hypothetical protein
MDTKRKQSYKQNSSLSMLEKISLINNLPFVWWLVDSIYTRFIKNQITCLSPCDHWGWFFSWRQHYPW